MARRFQQRQLAIEPEHTELRSLAYLLVLSGSVGRSFEAWASKGTPDPRDALLAVLSMAPPLTAAMHSERLVVQPDVRAQTAGMSSQLASGPGRRMSTSPGSIVGQVSLYCSTRM